MISQSSTQVLNQIENNVKKSKNIIKNKKTTFQNDYLNRAKTIDFILLSKPDFRTIQSLKQIKKLMNVEYIHIINNDGQIVLSSENDTLQDMISMKNIFQQWVHDDGENYILLGNESPCSEDLIAIKSKISPYSFILIGIDQKVYQEMIERYSIQTLISNSSIEKLISEYVIDLSNCQIIATSSKKMLRSHISLEHLEKIKNSNNGKIVHLDDYQYVKTKQLDNYLLVAATHFSAILYTFKEKLIFLFFIILLLILLIYILRNYFKKNIVEEISFMKTNVDKLVSGDKDIEFFVQNNEKFAKLNQSLNDLKKSYGYKANRMSKIIEFTGVDFAMFECLYAIDTNLFSKNIPLLLGLNQRTWLEIKAEPKKFENYILELEKQMNNEHLIELNGRYLSIYSYRWEDEFFGVIMDCTKDIHKNTILQNRLEQIEINSQIDTLTNIYNRKGFENHVKQYFYNNPKEGILLLFDLDNFKCINDNLGHQEGDKVLQIVARCLKQSFQNQDIIGRIGGDEFLVFMPQNIPIEKLEKQLEIIMLLMQKVLADYYRDYHVSMSIGISLMNQEIQTYQDLYRLADVTLYIAKRTGKNKYFINKDHISCMQGSCFECMVECKNKEVGK